MKKLNYILAAAVALALGGTFNAIAHEGEEHGHKHDNQAAGSGSVAALWKQIDTSHKELSEYVASKNWDKLDGPAHSMPALLVELGKHKDLPADKQKQVSGMANNAIKALEALHKSGHNKNEAELQAKFKSFEQVMKALKAQLPTDVAGA